MSRSVSQDNMALRARSQEERNRSQVFSQEAEPVPRYRKKVGFTVKDEVGEAMKQPHLDPKRAEDYKAPKKDFIPRPPPTPEAKHVSRKQYIPTPGKKGEEVQGRDLPEEYVESNDRLFNTKERPFATTTTTTAPDIGRGFKKMSLADMDAEKGEGAEEREAAGASPSSSPARPIRHGATMASLLKWDT